MPPAFANVFKTWQPLHSAAFISGIGCRAGATFHMFFWALHTCLVPTRLLWPPSRRSFDPRRRLLSTFCCIPASSCASRQRPDLMEPALPDALALLAGRAGVGGLQP